MYKMYAIVSMAAVKKTNGVRGKMTAQAGHAFLHAFWDAERRFVADARGYRNSEHATKITLCVDTDQELLALCAAYNAVCGTSLVTDAGFTVFNEPTITCLGIGPIHSDKVGQDLKDLKLFC
jgi:peptidyl-tRNA hydrolase